MSKEYSDICFNCGESKARIRHSQRVGDPIYCVTVSSTESGTEVDQEWDRHWFVKTDKQRAAEEADERAAMEYLGFAEFMEQELTQPHRA